MSLHSFFLSIVCQNIKTQLNCGDKLHQIYATQSPTVLYISETASTVVAEFAVAVFKSVSVVYSSENVVHKAPDCPVIQPHHTILVCEFGISMNLPNLLLFIAPTYPAVVLRYTH